jgi:hypothetical protein
LDGKREAAGAQAVSAPRCKAGEGLRIFGYFIRQELEGNKPLELDVLSLVDHTHSDASDFLDDAVVRDGLADHSRRCYVRETGKSTKAVELAASQEDDWRTHYFQPDTCSMRFFQNDKN